MWRKCLQFLQLLNHDQIRSFPFPVHFTSHYWMGHSFNNHRIYGSNATVITYWVIDWTYYEINQECSALTGDKGGAALPIIYHQCDNMEDTFHHWILWHESLCRATTAKFQHKFCLTPWTDLDLGEDGCQRGLPYLVSVITAALRIIIYWPQFWSLFFSFFTFSICYKFGQWSWKSGWLLNN